MPFKKTGSNEYTSPSGKKWTRKAMESYRNRKGHGNPNHKSKKK
jgi:hypothetical protein